LRVCFYGPCRTHEKKRHGPLPPKAGAQQELQADEAPPLAGLPSLRSARLNKVHFSRQLIRGGIAECSCNEAKVAIQNELEIFKRQRAYA
jgi:hypothetical protein